MPIPVILDCDPGHDDAFTILLAAAHPAVDLLAITTVAGNQTLEKTTLHARRVCSVAGISGVPIAAGRARPLHGPPRTAEDIHGESGLDGPGFGSGEPAVPEDPRGALALVRDTLLAHPVPVTLVPTGPLTNIAVLLLAHPELTSRIDRIVLMGGSTDRGNTTPAAEFNILCDPEAADIVLRGGVPVTMFGPEDRVRNRGQDRRRPPRRINPRDRVPAASRTECPRRRPGRPRAAGPSGTGRSPRG
ncbi:nucleoside hydrolase [Streptomyces sp. NPDC057695]|uniref:nucleoside hydrolase n=1 Tax=Streptomyces sp. NPDC057695 TaxID=3346217 RepID=UPI0036B726F1